MSATLVETVPFAPLRDAPPIQRWSLPNGLTVLIHEDHHAPIFAWHTWFRVGSRHERPGRTGMAHLFEHLMFKETTSLKEGEFDRTMELNGGQTNAATWVDWTYYHEKLPATRLDLVARLEADRMENMVLGTHQLETEREVVINERKLRVDNDPDGKAYEVLYAMAFGKDHPYGWPTIGWMEDIRAIGLQDCLDFYRTWYAPNNATIIVVGDVDPAAVMESIERHYGHIPPQEVPPPRPNPPLPPGPHRAEITLPLSGDRLICAWESVALDDPDLYAAEVLSEVLLNSDAARLSKRLVYDAEVASGASGWLSGFAWPGLLQIDVTMKPEVAAEEAEAIIDEELARVCAEVVGPEELERARTKVEVQVVRNLLSVDSKAHLLGLYEATVGSFKAALDSMDRLQAVTADDVLRVARRIFRDERRTTLIARPEEEA
ncbi:MAG: zinc protease [Myxococcales bacterium]